MAIQPTHFESGAQYYNKGLTDLSTGIVQGLRQRRDDALEQKRYDLKTAFTAAKMGADITGYESKLTPEEFTLLKAVREKGEEKSQLEKGILEVQTGQLEARRTDQEIARERNKLTEANQAFTRKSKMLDMLVKTNPTAARKYMQETFGGLGYDFENAPESKVQVFATEVEKIMRSDMNDHQKQRDIATLLSTTQKEGDLTSEDFRQIHKTTETILSSLAPARSNVETDTVANLLFSKSAVNLSPTEKYAVQEYTFLKDKMSFASEGSIKELSLMSARKERLTDIINKLETDPEAQAVLGFFQSKWDKVRLKFIADPKSETTRRDLMSLMDVLYETGGKQLSDTEIKLAFESFIPSVGQPPENAVAALKVLLEKTDRKYNSFKSALLAGGKITDGQQVKDFLSGKILNEMEQKKEPTKAPPEGSTVYIYDPKTKKMALKKD